MHTELMLSAPAHNAGDRIFFVVEKAHTEKVCAGMQQKIHNDVNQSINILQISHGFSTTPLV